MKVRVNHKKWRRKLQEVKRDIYALYLSLKDPRVPWYAKLFIALIVGYALSPIDLIPDFIPVLGYLDDIIVVPLGTLLAIKLIPAHVFQENRKNAEESIGAGKLSIKSAAVIVFLVWVLGAFIALRYALKALSAHRALH